MAPRTRLCVHACTHWLGPLARGIALHATCTHRRRRRRAWCHRCIGALVADCWLSRARGGAYPAARRMCGGATATHASQALLAAVNQGHGSGSVVAPLRVPYAAHGRGAEVGPQHAGFEYASCSTVVVARTWVWPWFSAPGASAPRPLQRLRQLYTVPAGYTGGFATRRGVGYRATHRCAGHAAPRILPPVPTRTPTRKLQPCIRLRGCGRHALAVEVVGPFARGCPLVGQSAPTMLPARNERTEFDPSRLACRARMANACLRGPERGLRPARWQPQVGVAHPPTTASYSHGCAGR